MRGGLVHRGKSRQCVDTEILVLNGGFAESVYSRGIVEISQRLALKKRTWELGLLRPVLSDSTPEVPSPSSFMAATPAVVGSSSSLLQAADRRPATRDCRSSTGAERPGHWQRYPMQDIDRWTDSRRCRCPF